MIHIFNRRELLLTTSMQQQAKVQDILADHGIECFVKAKSTTGGMSRSRTILPGTRMDAMYQYYIYVKKTDYEKAKQLIR